MAVQEMAVQEPNMYVVPKSPRSDFVLDDFNLSGYVNATTIDSDLDSNRSNGLNKSYQRKHEPKTQLDLDEPINYDDINYDEIITEDDEPVDNIPSEKTQRLAARSLFVSKHLQDPYVAMANVGLHYRPKTPAVVPDIMLTLDTEFADGSEIWDKENRTYYMWKHGKPPNVVVEIVSNKEGNEAGTKFTTYADIGVQYYVILDYNHHVQTETLLVYELTDGHYVARSDYRMEDINLAVGFWHGTFEKLTIDWLRWYTLDGEMLLTGEEGEVIQHQRADAAEALAEEERLRAEEERLRAEEERLRAEEERALREEAQAKADAMQAQMAQMMAFLQAQGFDPSEIPQMLGNQQ
ncbi:MAG: Uma2 family endonuclease [Chloroflexota bacterium]